MNKQRTDEGDAHQSKGQSEETDVPFNNPFLDDQDETDPPELRGNDGLTGDERDVSNKIGLPVDSIIREPDESWAPPFLEQIHEEPEAVAGYDENVDGPKAAEVPDLAEDNDASNPLPDKQDHTRVTSGIARITDRVKSLLSPKGGSASGIRVENSKNLSSFDEKHQIREALSDSLEPNDNAEHESAPGTSQKRVQPKLDMLDEMSEPSSDEPIDSATETPGQTKPSEPEEVDDKPDDDETFVYPEIKGFTMLSQIDYWAKISGGQDVGCQKILAFYNLAAPMIPELTQIYGLCLPDLEWRDIKHEAGTLTIRDIVITVQLADRNGSVSDASIEKFISLNTRIAKVTGKDLTFMASPKDAMKQAKCITEFARTYQSVYAITVVPDKTDSFHVAEIHKFASQRGLHPNDSGFYVRNKTVGKKKVSVYSLVNMTKAGTFDFSNLQEEISNGVMFYSLPILHNSPGAVFSEMADSARAFASRFRAQAMLPDSEALTQEESDRFRRLIESSTGRIESYGITSGSDEAIRIFGLDAA